MFPELAARLGVAPDLVKIIACLVLNYPLCVAVTLVPWKTVKNLFVVAFGLFYLIGIFDFYLGTLILIAQCVLAFAVACTRPSTTFLPWLNQLLQIGILMVTHCREQFSGEDYVNEIGISGSQMILVIKLTSYVWDVYDGTRDPKLLNDHQSSSRVRETPSFLTYIAWCLFFPSVLTGPTCQFSDYRLWLGNTVTYTVDGKQVTRTIPSSYKAAALKTVQALFWTWIYLSASSFISFDYPLSAAWRAQTFFVRASYLALVAVSYQLKFYVAWTFAEAACILCGLGYNGPNPAKQGHFKWDRLQNVRPLKILTAQNCHGYVNNWNINTAMWLRHYVYERVTPPGRKPGLRSTLATFVFSAVWHGTRPGYYLTFVIAAIYQRFGRLFRHKLRPIFVGTDYKFAYDIVCWVVTQTAFGFAAQPFIVLDMKPSMQIWSGVYYWPILGCVASYIVIVWPLGSVFRSMRRTLHKDLKENE